jgi:hypothetical protein
MKAHVPRPRPRTTCAAVLAAIPPAAEAAALYAAGAAPAAGLAAQATAPPPFGVYHDLRWILVFHHGWWMLAAELAAMLLFRTLLGTAMAALLWPDGHPRPALRRLAAAQLLFTALAAVLLSPWAILAFLAAVTSLSWFLFGSVLALLVLSLVLTRGGLAPGWWRHPPAPGPVAAAVLTFVWLSAASAVISAVAGPWKPVAAAASGLAGTALWAWAVRMVARPAPARPLRALTPLCVLTATAVLLTAGSGLLGREHGAPAPPQATAAADHLPPPDRRQVLYLYGFGSSYGGEQVTGYPSDLAFTHFSYRGQYQDGAPLPYGPRATHRSLAVLAGLLHDQVQTLHRRSGKDVALVAESEGSLVARAYLRLHPHAPVDALVLISPLVRPVRVYYPPRNASHGWGLAAGWETRLLATLARAESDVTVHADGGFARSLVGHAPWFRTTMMCPVPGIRVTAFLPTASASVVPPGHHFGVTTVEMRGLHGTLVSPGRAVDRITTALRGRHVHGDTLTVYRLIQDAAAGWQAPELPLGYVAAWRNARPEQSAPAGELPPDHGVRFPC